MDGMRELLCTKYDGSTTTAGVGARRRAAQRPAIKRRNRCGRNGASEHKQACVPHACLIETTLPPAALPPFAVGKPATSPTAGSPIPFPSHLLASFLFSLPRLC